MVEKFKQYSLSPEQAMDRVNYIISWATQEICWNLIIKTPEQHDWRWSQQNWLEVWTCFFLLVIWLWNITVFHWSIKHQCSEHTSISLFTCKPINSLFQYNGKMLQMELELCASLFDIWPNALFRPTTLVMILKKYFATT